MSPLLLRTDTSAAAMLSGGDPQAPPRYRPCPSLGFRSQHQDKHVISVSCMELRREPERRGHALQTAPTPVWTKSRGFPNSDFRLVLICLGRD
ncbi:uncharacterized [Tachysurus ichikawai]